MDVLYNIIVFGVKQEVFHKGEDEQGRYSARWS